MISARVVFIACMFAICSQAYAAKVVVDMHLIDSGGMGKNIGTVTAEDSNYGLVLVPDLKGLSPGEHGFHVHRNGDCGPGQKEGKSVAGLAAGGHYDPANTGKHEGPSGSGHLGDLPVLVVNPDGTATLPVIAPRLKVSDLAGRSLMVHEGGDNYSDQPKALGGGGPRVACGVVKSSEEPSGEGERKGEG